jgi:HCOMODA/2-hydroxy-3-carboxy-muconic semialdehyde decarboxylase
MRELVVANRILGREQICDYLGHVSIRHPDRPDRFILSRSRSPELVTLDDLMEYDLDCNPIDQQGKPMYIERPIHGAIYQARPDVTAVVHNHAYEVIPFALVTSCKLRPVVPPACGIGMAAPVWDIRDKFGDTTLMVTSMDRGHDLAKTLGAGRVSLMRGHGCVTAARSLRESVLDAIYLRVNARLQAEAMRMGEVAFLSPGEIAETVTVVYTENSLQRAWEYWERRCGIAV